MSRLMDASRHGAQAAAHHAKKILVVGGHGKTGLCLLSLLQDSPHTVTATIRDSDHAKDVRSYGAEPLIIDLEKDCPDIAKGMDAVFFVAGSGGKRLDEVDLGGLVRVISSAVKHGVGRFIHISSLNIGKQQSEYVAELEAYYGELGEEVPESLHRAIASDGYHRYVGIKEQGEGKLMASGLNYTIFRAGMLTGTVEAPDGEGKIEAGEGTLSKFGKISRFDVAQCFVSALDMPEAASKTFTILGGVESIDEALVATTAEAESSIPGGGAGGA